MPEEATRDVAVRCAQCGTPPTAHDHPDHGPLCAVCAHRQMEAD